jgi:hypothetical protein
MAKSAKVGLPVVGIIFLAVGVIKFLDGGNWVVWAILGVLFGGLGVFNLRKSEGEGQ